MFNTLITHLEVIIRGYGALGVFIAAFLEEVVAPIPSSLVAMFAGFFLIPVEYSFLQAIITAFFHVAIPMALGITVGSALFYAAAYFGGKPLIIRYGKWFGLSWTLIEKTEKKFTKGSMDEIVLLVLRSVPFVPSVALSAFCGLVRYPLKTFLILTFAGSLIRASIMALIGWQVRDAYVVYANFTSTIETLSLVVIALCIGAFILYSRRVSARHTSQHID